MKRGSASSGGWFSSPAQASKSTESLSSEEFSTAEANFDSVHSENQEEMPVSSSTPTSSPTGGNESAQSKESKENDLIDAFNQLQIKMAACGQKFFPNLPCICVLGVENTGKSSVLQSFVGKDFLPNGNGLVTRRPTIVQLEPTAQGSKEYGVFAHLPMDADGKPQRIYDFAAIRKEIKDETDRMPGPSKFSSEPIVLSIYSPRVLKLTLVDLPGIVECPVDDQDASVVQTVEQMVRERISEPETIIMAVHPADQPIATSKALKIAQEVDPKFERTIGVITKVDREEPGSMLEVFENRKLPLARGYVGVVCRSPADLASGKDRDYELANETRFFRESPCYGYMAKRMGSAYLQELLHKTLKEHINSLLPSIREDLTLRLSRMRRELREFTETVGESDSGEGSNFYLMHYVNNFVDRVHVDIMGYSDDVPDATLSTGAHLNFILNYEAQKLMSVDTTPDEKDLARLMANICGIRNNVSFPSLLVHAICRRLVDRFIDPLETSMLTIRDVLLDTVLEQTSVMDRYPSLKNQVIYMIKDKMTQLTDATREHLVEYCRAEQTSINIGHPDYNMDQCSSIAPQAGCTKVWEEQPEGATASGRPVAAEPGRKEELLTLLMQNECYTKRIKFVSQMITNYMTIVKKNVMHIYFVDVKYQLVFKFMDYLKRLFTIELSNNWASTLKKSLARDCEEDFKKKAEVEAKCKYLEEALASIKAF